MKLRFLTILIAIFAQCAAFCHTSIIRPNNGVSTPWSSGQHCRFIISTSLYSGERNDESSLDDLLKTVEEISNDQFSPQVAIKMTELEKALLSLLEDERKTKPPPTPRPPGIPPPLTFLEKRPDGEGVGSLEKAEEALEKLRRRLRREGEFLRQAEEALKNSLVEEEVLRKAEVALKKSREAAEKRKTEAIRRTEAALASAEKARQLQESIGEPTSESAENSPVVASEVTEARSTFAIGARFQENCADVPPSENENSVPDVDAPAGVAVLYDWVQYIDGSIRARVRGKQGFQDGATVSTSAVALGVKGGNVIETASGSQYYLAKPNWTNDKQKIKTSAPLESQSTTNSPATEPPEGMHLEGGPTKRELADWVQTSRTENSNSIPRDPMNKAEKAPEGVPSILNWEVRDDGGVSGLIYGSRKANNGDFIETSPIAEGTIENGCVVVTRSGSRYFLSADTSEELGNQNIMSSFKGLTAGRKSGTITITKEMGENETPKAMEMLEKAKPRSTFSLMDLFGAKGKKTPKPASSSGKAPKGIPTLSYWTINGDGTVTGVISGSPTLNDGDMVTTSPIAQGITERYQVVTTLSGSNYFLG